MSRELAALQLHTSFVTSIAKLDAATAPNSHGSLHCAARRRVFCELKPESERKRITGRSFAVAEITLHMCAMAACRRSARLAPLATQKVVTPTGGSKKVSLAKSLKVEPCTSPEEVCAQGLEIPTPPSSGSKRKLAFEKDRTVRSKSVRPIACRESEKITHSFRVVKQEVCEVDKDVKPLPVGLSSRRATRKAKVEATESADNVKKPVVRGRREKSKTDDNASLELKARPTVKKKIKKEKTDAAPLLNAKDESGSTAKVESGALVATGPSLALAAQATLELAVTSGSPYPDFARPYPEECREVRNRLSELHGMGSYARGKSCPSIDPIDSRDPPQVLALEYRSGEKATVDTAEILELSEIVEAESEDKGDVKAWTGSPSVRRTVLDSLVGTILSQNTTDNNSKRAFASLKQVFPTWEEVHAADPRKVEDAIRCGGLAETKAKRIVNILDTVLKERGSICLEYVRSMTVDQIKAELSRFKGVGPKTVACVLMFHLEQNEFPVDTHVFRLSKMLGWVPANADREKTYLHMNNRVPDDVKYDLHCLLVTHGKKCPRCAKGGRAQTAPDGPCPLINWSPKMALKNSEDLELLKGEE
ncbi:hypothetical protein M758_9G158900 [Ceratodon purpureus]|nr:hypothetical protein M758_9G158900 [Ceratodon purpureus]